MKKVQEINTKEITYYKLTEQEVIELQKNYYFKGKNNGRKEFANELRNMILNFELVLNIGGIQELLHRLMYHIRKEIK
jgi:hypothetical protein